MRLKSEAIKLNPDILLIDKNNQNINIIEAIIKRKTFIFRFTEPSCFSCISSYFELIAQEINSIDRILIIGGINQLDKIPGLINYHDLTVPYYICQQGILETALDTMGLPYCMVLTKMHNSLITSNLFVPNNDRERLDEYLRIINVDFNINEDSN
jgi:hypothetical protein